MLIVKSALKITYASKVFFSPSGLKSSTVSAHAISKSYFFLASINRFVC
jgi:hypothetical protein